MKDFGPFAGFSMRAILISLALFVLINVLGEGRANWLQIPVLYATVFFFWLIPAVGVLAVVLSIGFGLWRATQRIPIWIATALQGMLASVALMALASVPSFMEPSPKELGTTIWQVLDETGPFLFLAVPVFAIVGYRRYG